MNSSYFEQGFYGSHHHQGGTAAAHHADQAAAYRFPLGLGMSPYASSQHHHHHHSLHQSRPPQDSPYDASVAAACKLYTASQNDNQTSINYSTSTKPDCSKSGESPAHQNGYAAVVAAAKDVWNASGATAPSSNPLVRPAACTPDGRYAGLPDAGAGGSPGSVSRTSASSLAPSWNQCNINSAPSQPAVASQIHQQAGNHTFYPWMAIAGK
ncbi:Homeotic protein ultrabithorax [Nesidiocoris tenuis]|uniref:Homeotic protein ultrabithorax n=1 Tax=Nesidiocoris tenuis TaxID=355587 RepID=A0ABN7AXC5_9HEMI|nr:Homeotic protein ultrabithorax [Nesidiocoris tenuis]